MRVLVSTMKKCGEYTTTIPRTRAEGLRHHARQCLFESFFARENGRLFLSEDARTGGMLANAELQASSRTSAATTLKTEDIKGLSRCGHLLDILHSACHTRRYVLIVG